MQVAFSVVHHLFYWKCKLCRSQANHVVYM